MTCLAVSFASQEVLRSSFWPQYYGTRHLGSIKSVALSLLVLGTALGPGLTGVLLDLDVGIRTQFAALVLGFLLASVALRVGLVRARALLPAAT